MELNLEQKQQLEKLLAKPALVQQADIPLLQSLIQAYPYYQPLYLLLAKAGVDTAQKQHHLAKAALYNNGNILHRVIHEPKDVVPMEDAKVISYEARPSAKTINLVTQGDDLPEPSSTQTAAETTESNRVDEAPYVENLAPLANEVIAWEEQETEPAPITQQPEVLEQEEPAAQKPDFVVPEIENLAPLANEVIGHCEKQEPDSIPDEVVAAEQPAPEPEADQQPETDEQETFDEISELVLPADDTEKEQLAAEEAENVGAAAPVVENIDEETETTEPTSNVPVESVASTDFFAFERNFSAERITEESEEQLAETPAVGQNEPEPAAENIVSKYDDDQLPFTFLWWLAKTRKDHEQTFQPYVSAISTPDLQQQYVENIFHLKTPFEATQMLAEPETKLDKANSKEEELIDNFIKNEPQIKVPKPDQINTENKAKRSAEDNYDLVSETLAEIYIEQMLYHKAIDTYQKLSLKFPEKSRYFADLIQSLEKKI
jgi:hypothetical protein